MRRRGPKTCRIDLPVHRAAAAACTPTSLTSPTSRAFKKAKKTKQGTALRVVHSRSRTHLPRVGRPLEQQILRLEVPVDHSPLVAVVQTEHKLLEEPERRGLRETGYQRMAIPFIGLYVKVFRGTGAVLQRVAVWPTQSRRKRCLGSGRDPVHSCCLRIN
jgi:hypothetical protein